MKVEDKVELGLLGCKTKQGIWSGAEMDVCPTAPDTDQRAHPPGRQAAALQSRAQSLRRAPLHRRTGATSEPIFMLITVSHHLHPLFSVSSFKKLSSPPFFSLLLVMLVTLFTLCSPRSHCLHLEISQPPHHIQENPSSHLNRSSSLCQDSRVKLTSLSSDSALSSPPPQTHTAADGRLPCSPMPGLPHHTHRSHAPLCLWRHRGTGSASKNPDLFWAWLCSPNPPTYLDLPTALSPRQMIFTLSSASYFSWSSSQGLALSLAIGSWL